MVELRWIRTLLTLLLQSAAATGQYSSLTIRAGDGATLPCDNVIPDQDRCDGTTWIFSGTGNIVNQVTLGKIQNVKSGRLSVGANCSLVIKKVEVEDAGRYDCQQYKLDQQQGDDKLVQLSVITMDGSEKGEQVTVSCSVWTPGCRHTIKWLYDGKQVDEAQTYENLQSRCLVHFSYPKKSSKNRKLFKCEVIDGYSQQVQRFPLSPVEDVTAATTLTTVISKIRTNSAGPAINKTPTPAGSWWLFVCVAVGLVTLGIIILSVVRWKKTKGNKINMDDNTELSLNPAATQSAPETTQDTADPEDGVSYASVSYTKKPNSRAQVTNDGDEGEAVTYSTVKASSSSAGGSDDPSALYATIKKSDR